MNKALEELKEDCTVDKIIGNYIGDDTGKYQYESPADVDHSKGTLVMATNAEFEQPSAIKWDMNWKFWIWNLTPSFHQLQQERLTLVQQV